MPPRTGSGGRAHNSVEAASDRALAFGHQPGVVLHDVLGTGVAAEGLSAVYMAFFAYGGPFARMGFASLALGWLYTGVQGYGAIRRRAWNC